MLIGYLACIFCRSEFEIEYSGGLSGFSSSSGWWYRAFNGRFFLATSQRLRAPRGLHQNRLLGSRGPSRGKADSGLEHHAGFRLKANIDLRDPSET